MEIYFKIRWMQLNKNVWPQASEASTATKTLFREKCTVLNTYTRRKKWHSIQIPSYNIKYGRANDIQSKQKKGNNKVLGRLILKTTTTEVENRKKKWWNQSQFCEKVNKIKKPLVRMIRKKKIKDTNYQYQETLVMWFGYFTLWSLA